jgi:hypothetical protein
MVAWLYIHSSNVLMLCSCALCSLLFRISPTGKTVFLAYLLRAIAHHFSDRDVAIVCESAALNFCALMHSRRTEVTVWHETQRLGHPPQVVQLLTLSDTWWLVDAFSPTLENCRTVLVTSPRADIANDFQKDPFTVSER